MEPVAGNTLSKAERLSSKKDISRLIGNGRWGVCDAVSRILISVPKRNFKRAVKRNLLKRRIRESYRLQKDLLPAGVDIAFVYISREVLPFEDVYASMTTALTAAAQQVSA